MCHLFYNHAYCIAPTGISAEQITSLEILYYTQNTVIIQFNALV